MTRNRYIAASVLALAMLSGCGSNSEPIDNSFETVISGSDVAEFLAGDVIHEITVDMDEAEYTAAIEAYETDESKKWIHATVTIDGSVYEDAGIRLKGNSSLFALRGEGRAGPGGTADTANPESLPWLIRLDKYVSGQAHNGISDIVIRSNNTVTALNEAAALELLELAGLAYQDSAYTSFSVNASDEVLRLAVEHPDSTWMASQFSMSGILYKAEAAGDYSYRGDSPETYEDVFDVEAGADDLSPLIEFLDFLNNSDDATFYTELDRWLDTESFATYLALQEMIANNDDIDGRGNNSYLYFDVETLQFTVVAWDHNLAFGGLGDGPDTPGGEFTRPDRNTLPGGVEPAEGFTDIATDRQPVAPEGRPGGAPGPTAGNNILVDRFLADDAYAALYEGELERLTAELYESGAAEDVLSDWVTLLEGSDLVASTTIAAEAAVIRSYFE